MSGIFANGLEISGKAVDAKTIAAFPDVCFTPPENPATPPGLPVPYPSFGMASDTDKGTGTVKIGGKTVNIKNRSYLSQTSGTEAGCAAKKGLITSKNSGKEYFNSWSSNVKFDGEPVIRFTDLATNNHASPTANTPPWAHIAKMALAGENCEKIYNILGGHRHSRRKSKCDFKVTGKESEHTSQVGCFMKDREGKVECKKWKKYRERAAPCICMHAERKNPKPKPGQAPKKGTEHDRKTKAVKAYLDRCRKGCLGKDLRGSCAEKCRIPTAGQITDVGAKATAKHHAKIRSTTKDNKKKVSNCLAIINMAYLAGVTEDHAKEKAKEKMEKATNSPVCTKGVCIDKSKKCHGC